MQLDDLNVLAAFLAVAEEQSFTRAAKRAGVSRSALSHCGARAQRAHRRPSAVANHPQRCANRCRRRLIARLRPALGDVGLVLDEIMRLRVDGGGDRLIGSGRRSEDGAAWQTDLSLTYTRLQD